MKKTEFISEISAKSGYTQKDVQQVLKHFQTVLLEELKKTGEVRILELGQFKIVQRSARAGVNPKTKEKLEIPATKVPRLSPSRKFRDFVATGGSTEGFVY